jgi:hypothetical protein
MFMLLAITAGTGAPLQNRALALLEAHGRLKLPLPSSKKYWAPQRAAQEIFEQDGSD